MIMELSSQLTKAWGLTVSLFVLLGAMLLAGCGSGAEEQAEAPTKAEFIKRGNEICERNQDEIFAAIKKAEAKLGTGGLSPEAREHILNRVVPPFLEHRTEELASLVAPVGDEKKVKAIVSGYEEGVEAIEAKPSLATTGRPLDPGTDAAKAYGVDACS